MLTEFRNMLRCAGATAIIITVFPGLSANLVSALDARAETVSPLLGGAAEQISPAAISEQEEHGLSQKALEITRVFGFPITNSMVVTWIVALGLIVLARLATRSMKQVPDGLQNFLEWLIDSLYRFLEGVICPHFVERTLWLFGTMFV